jgi:hypothetical protein
MREVRATSQGVYIVASDLVICKERDHRGVSEAGAKQLLSGGLSRYGLQRYKQNRALLVARLEVEFVSR